MNARTRWTWVLATAAAAAAITLVLHTVKAQETAPATAPAPAVIRTAVCNAYEIMKRYEGITALAQTLDKERDALNTESKRRKEEIDKLREELSSLNPGTEPYQAKLKQIDEKVMSTKAWEEQELLQRKRRAAEAIHKAHKAMADAAAAIAREQNFHLVLNHSEMSMEGLQPDEMQAVVRGQRVLYNDSSIDITQQVLARMNANFAAQGK